MKNGFGTGMEIGVKGIKNKPARVRPTHCEIAITAHRIANPQWTPLVDDAPEWMQLGCNLYSALKGICQVHEVFSTAFYKLLSGVGDVRL